MININLELEKTCVNSKNIVEIATRLKNSKKHMKVNKTILLEKSIEIG